MNIRECQQKETRSRGTTKLGKSIRKDFLNTSQSRRGEIRIDKRRSLELYNVVQMEGIKPSDDFFELVEKEKRGEINGDDIQRILRKKYTAKQDKDNQ